MPDYYALTLGVCGVPSAMEIMSSATSNVMIVVPVVRSVPTADEQISWQHLLTHLGRHPICLLAAEQLDLRWFTGQREDAHVLRVPAADLASRRSYSRMLMRDAFYRQFTAHECLLIYQLDCLVFRDELEAWCRRPYDYVGAPWSRADGAGGFAWLTGNGGFSLRRVDAFLRVLTTRRHPRVQAELAAWAAWLDVALRLPLGARRRSLSALACDVRALPGRLKAVQEQVGRPLAWLPYGGVRVFQRAFKGNEDLFWALVAPLIDPAFRVAPADAALAFAFELEPRAAFERTGRRLPFGCHAWPRYDRAFWEPYLQR